MPDGDRLVRVDDLVGAADIADRLGYAHPQSIALLRRRHADFPPPLRRFGRTDVWAWTDVEAWQRRRS